MDWCFLKYRRFNRQSIDRLIDDMGVEYLWNDRSVQDRICALIHLDKQEPLHRYFMDKLRYLALKSKLIKSTGLADKQLLSNGPAVPVIEHKKIVKETPKPQTPKKSKKKRNKQVSEGSIASGILSKATSRFTPRYRFVCSVCDCREYNGNGYRMPSGEYEFICQDCFRRLHLTETMPKVMSVPMGGMNKYKRR